MTGSRTNMNIILASGSPRRKELMADAGYVFDIEISNAEENAYESDPAGMVEELSLIKAMAVAKIHTNDPEPVLVVGADTVVAHKAKVLGKPVDEEDAYRMLKDLSADTHQVYTGVSLIVVGQGKVMDQKSFHECTNVSFIDISDDEIWGYIATGEPMDKAGAYGIQGGAGAFVQEYRGDYNNVVGLPVDRLKKEIEKLLCDHRRNTAPIHKGKNFITNCLTFIFMVAIMLSIVACSFLDSQKNENNTTSSSNSDAGEEILGSSNSGTGDASFNIVTSFYPMYIIMMNLTDGADVTLSNMAKPQTGCLHDYQLRPQDLITLSAADLFVANGGGMEEFLSDVLESKNDNDSINVIYAMDALDENELIQGEETPFNPHTWMNPQLYKKEICYLAEKLKQADPAGSSIYQKNCEDYISRINAMLKKHSNITSETSNTSETNKTAKTMSGVIILHESFEYLTEKYDIPVSGGLEVEKDSGFSPGELREIIEEAREMKAGCILSDDQYSGRIAELLKNELKIPVITLGSGVSGEYEKDSWIKMMEADLSKLIGNWQADKD